MILRLLALTALLASSFASYTMNDTKKIKMPKKDILTERLRKIDGIDHFIQETEVLLNFADQEKKDPLTISLDLDRCLRRYDRYLAEMNNDTALVMSTRIHKKKPKILKALLEDHPEVLKKLEEDGLYNPNE